MRQKVMFRVLSIPSCSCLRTHLPGLVLSLNALIRFPGDSDQITVQRATFGSLR